MAWLLGIDDWQAEESLVVWSVSDSGFYSEHIHICTHELSHALLQLFLQCIFFCFYY